MSAGEPGRTAGGVGLIFSGGELRATNPYGRLPGRPMGECYHIPERALGGFLMGHAHELDSSDVDLPRVFGIMAGRSRDNGENPRHRRGPNGSGPGLTGHRRCTREERDCSGLSGLPHRPPSDVSTGEECHLGARPGQPAGSTVAVQEGEFSVRELAGILGVGVGRSCAASTAGP